ncbi:Ger(x)C family spore germination protein [Paenibacillus albicereus]|uniref:Ger(X)C family spore germination protein n=1 Tax=Paenibacillus albicereus TaxID=2726185 RepID=A0A6H2H2E3_9BACL|nr:Ger(x)C family spore germination protein [Paenibacillus albicereus]QJC53508.1 Ger(x)C family spore germination protein [Paenibacillus albicereus]
MRSLLLAALALAGGLLLAGCWDRQELEDRALILGMAIDEADGDEKDEHATHLTPPPTVKGKKIRITAQIAIPGRVPLGPSDSGGGGKEGGMPVWVVRVTGYSIDDALNNLQQEIADPRSLIHLRVIVISEKIARRGVEDLNDYFRRNSEVRRSTWLLVSDIEADRLMGVAPPLERIPSLYLLSMIEKSMEMGKFPKEYIGSFWTAESSKGQDEFLPYISIRQKENILLKGIALFSGGRMVGHTEPIEIGAYMALKGMNPGGYSNFIQVPDVGTLMLTTFRRQAETDIRIEDDVPHIRIKVRLDTRIEERLDNESDAYTASDYRKIEEHLEENVSRILRGFIRSTQQLKSDPFGFGEALRGQYPRYWNRHIETKSDWESLYAQTRFDIGCEIYIRREGLKTN